MSDQKKVSGGIVFLSFVGVLVITLILVYGWPTRYRYEHFSDRNILIRIDRFNGDSQFFTPSGWKTYEEKPNKTAELMRDLWAGVSSSNQDEGSSPEQVETKIAPTEVKSTYDPQGEQAKAEEFLNQAGQIVPIQELSSIQSSCEFNTQGFKCQINNTSSRYSRYGIKDGNSGRTNLHKIK